MIDIGTHGGIIHEVKLTYKAMSRIMSDNVIKDHEFIEFEFCDGTNGSVKKSCVEIFYENNEKEES